MLFVTLIAVPISLLVILRTPHAQTFAARYAAGYLSEKLQAELTIGSLFLGLDFSIHIKDISLKDKHNNALFAAKDLKISVFPLNLTNKLDVYYASVSNFQAQIVRYKDEEDLNFQFVSDYFSSESVDTTVAKPYPILIESLRLDNGSFTYKIEELADSSLVEMDYNNLQLENIFLEATDLVIIKDSVEAQIKKLQAKERSGIELKSLKANLQMHSNGLEAKGLSLITPKSSVHMDLKLDYHGYGAFLDFIDSVKLTAKVEPSSLYLADIGVFAPIMWEMPDLIAFSGLLDGYVSDFITRDMSFSFGEHTSFKGDIEMRGLPDFFQSDISLDVKRFETEISDIETFAIPIEGNFILLPETFDQLGKINLEGSFKGKYEDFVTRFKANTDIGQITADLVFRTNELTKLPHYSTTMNVVNLQLGKLISNEELFGNTSFAAKIRGMGFETKTAEVFLEGTVSSFDFSGNTFNNIPLSAELADQIFMGDLALHEDNVWLDFDGSMDVSEDIPKLDLQSDIKYIDLFKIGLIENDSIMRLSSKAKAQFSGFDPDSILGELQIDSLVFLSSAGQLLMNELNMKLLEDSYLGRKCLINNDFFDFEMGGDFKIMALGNSFKDYLNHYISFGFLNVLDEKLIHSSYQDFYFNLKINDLNPLMPLFAPSLSIAPNSSLSGVFTEKNNSLNSTFRSDWVAVGDVRMEMPYLLINSDIKSAGVTIEMSDLIFKEAAAKDSIDFGMERPKLILNAANDTMFFQLDWNNQRLKMLNKGTINGIYNLNDAKEGAITMGFTDVIINDTVVQLKEGNRISFEKEVTRIEKFELQMGESKLGLDGSIPFREQDSLVVAFKNWNISAFDVITGTIGFDLDGIINGDLVLSNLIANPYFSSNLHISGLGLNKERLGDARILSNWSNNDKSIYANVQIINAGNTGNSRMLNLRGFYYPARKKDNISFDLSLENFRLRILNQFFVGIISKLEGVASGDFTLEGEIDKPIVKGKLELARTAFLIDYLNVKYSLQHTVEVLPGLIPIQNLVLYDTTGKKAIINGSITHNHLLDWAFDLSIKPESLLAMNTGPKQNELFYGSAVATGEVLVKGPLDNIDMSIKAISQKGTSIVIPLNTAGTVGSSDFIHFIEKKSESSADSLLLASLMPVVANTGFAINLATEVTPDASVKIFLPYDMGSLEARGNGNIALSVNNAGNFTLNGDYFVDNGLFIFTFENLLKKRFELMEGGRITWTGDPYEADIDVKGVYRVKASLAGLGIDTTSSLRNRINVDCIIHLTNGLFNPDIRFSFALPGADTDIEQRVFTVIDTTNDAAMTQQMVSLLVLGSFASTNIGNSSLTNSTFEMLSGQLSGLLSQISKDFDIGLNYRPGDALSNEELEVALSTQLFNDRVSIEGNFGVSNNKNVSQSASNIVGDVDVSVKLNADGSFRLKAFNHSNHSSWLNYGVFDNYAPYTQGIGISYRQEFDTFNELIQKKKNKKNKTK